MTSRNLARSSGCDGLVAERLDVAADGGERRPQFVRHVGDEVAAHLVGATQVGDVVQDEHRAAAARRRHGSGASDDPPVGGVRAA